MIDELHSKLKTFGQEHLLTGIETLTSSARETYLAALNRLDVMTDLATTLAVSLSGVPCT